MKEISYKGWNYLEYAGKVPVGLVLVHQIMGLDDYAKSVAAQLSDAGYWVMAVDLFRGKHPDSFKAGMEIRDSIKKEAVQEALSGGWHLLRERVGSGGRIGTIGFCMGGGFALYGACHESFDFCIDFYGMIENVEEVERLSGPTLLMLGSLDERITPWAFSSLLPMMAKKQKRIDIHLYPNARHAFHQPGREGYNAEAAKDAWSKTLRFLEDRRREAITAK